MEAIHEKKSRKNHEQIKDEHTFLYPHSTTSHRGIKKTETARATSSFHCGTWNVVPSPSPGNQSNAFNGVAAVSVSNVWAVGQQASSGIVSPQALIEHWDGTSWSVFSSPNLGTQANYLHSVAVVSANNVWAVGVVYTNNGLPQSLIEHWDGTIWSIVPSPNPGTQGNIFLGVAAVSASNVWATGDYVNSSGIVQSLIEHWDGTSWSVVSSPNPGTQYNYLLGITAFSAHNVWTVGLQVSNAIEQTLTEHWNGTRWKLVSSPNVGSSSNTLDGVARIPGTNQVWAVGVYVAPNTEVTQTLIEHWNGTSWSIVSSPNVGSINNSLSGVTAISKNNAWTVGYSGDNPYQTLTEHWDGTSWSVVPSPNPGTGTSNFLNGVTRVPGTNQVWAVGYDTDSTGVEQTLTDFYC